MKQIILLLAILWAMAINAQQNFFAPPTSSPVIGKDGSVTFKVKAPSADTVRLIIDTRCDTLMQRQGDGMWQLKLQGLEPDLYMYHYIIDGMKVLDNDNALVLRDVKNVMNTFVLDPNGDCPMAVHDVPHGDVQAVWYDSPTLGQVVTKQCGWNRVVQPKCSTTSSPAGMLFP